MVALSEPLFIDGQEIVPSISAESDLPLRPGHTNYTMPNPI